MHNALVKEIKTEDDVQASKEFAIPTVQRQRVLIARDPKIETKRSQLPIYSEEVPIMEAINDNIVSLHSCIFLLLSLLLFSLIFSFSLHFSVPLYSPFFLPHYSVLFFSCFFHHVLFSSPVALHFFLFLLHFTFFFFCLPFSQYIHLLLFSLNIYASRYKSCYKLH